jgi:hypothetical protein
MQIPKQPRTKSPAPEVSQPESQPAGNQGSAPPAAEDLNKQLQQAYSSYLENINSANLHAQLEHAKAYLAYLETLQQHQTRSGSDPALEYWKEILQAHDNAQASADAHKKFAMASVEQQAAYQKILTDAVTAYSQSTREISDKLQSDVGQHAKEMADSLKDALVKADVSTANFPALSLLYQSIRTMGAA